MDILSIFKRKKNKNNQDNHSIDKIDSDTTPNPYNIQSIQHHKTRVENLCNEYNRLYIKLQDTQSGNILPKGDKKKEVDSIIFKLVTIKYEVDIRKDLLNGLNN